MRTKTLLITAALSAAGIATSMAQVYSVNAVGYINKTIFPGFNLIANQLTQSNQTLDALIPAPADSTSVYKFVAGVGGGFQIRQFDSTIPGWDPDGGLTLTGGSGVFVRNVSGAPFTVTFVGDVPQGPSLTVPVVNGLNLIASIVPQAGLISTQLGFPAENSDVCYQFVNNGVITGSFVINQYDDTIPAWDPAEPNLSVGEGFWLKSDGTHANWVRAFTVN